MDFPAFKEHYWKTEGEKRINRKQFIVRSIGIFLLELLVGIAPILLVFFDEKTRTAVQNGEVLTTPLFAILMFMALVMSYFLYKAALTTYTKRYYDFNGKAGYPRVFLTVGFILLILTVTDQLAHIYVNDANNWMLTNLATADSPLSLSGILDIMSSGIDKIVVILFLYGAFKKGTQGQNTYGEEPTNNPII